MDGRPEGQSDGDGNRAGRGGPGGEYLLPTEEEESGSEVESSRSGQADGPGREYPVQEEEESESEVEPSGSGQADPREEASNEIRSPDEGDDKWLRCQWKVDTMLEDLQKGKIPEGNSEETSSDWALSQLNHKNFPILR